jgi:hypothetical protein
VYEIQEREETQKILDLSMVTKAQLNQETNDCKRIYKMRKKIINEEAAENDEMKEGENEIQEKKTLEYNQQFAFKDYKK